MKLNKDQINIFHQFQNEKQIKDKEYSEYFNEIHLYYQNFLNEINQKINCLKNDKNLLKIQNENQLKSFEEVKQKQIENFLKKKENFSQKFFVNNNLIKLNIKSIELNQNEENQMKNYFSQKTLFSIQFKFTKQIQEIQLIFSQVNQRFFHSNVKCWIF